MNTELSLISQFKKMQTANECHPGIRVYLTGTRVTGIEMGTRVPVPITSCDLADLRLRVVLIYTDTVKLVTY